LGQCSFLLNFSIFQVEFVLLDLKIRHKKNRYKAVFKI